jgi:uncharacterized protein YfkK (UPF0435 family)
MFIPAFILLLLSNVISILYILELKSIKNELEEEITQIHKFITDKENIN